jgi:hypothetical protein
MLVRQLAPKYDDIPIDVGGRDTGSLRAALAVADTILVPVQSRSFDFWPIDDIAALVAEAREINERLRAVTILNAADAQGSDNQAAAQALAEARALEYLPTIIGRRKAFSKRGGRAGIAALAAGVLYSILISERWTIAIDRKPTSSRFDPEKAGEPVLRCSAQRRPDPRFRLQAGRCRAPAAGVESLQKWRPSLARWSMSWLTSWGRGRRTSQVMSPPPQRGPRSSWHGRCQKGRRDGQCDC